MGFFRLFIRRLLDDGHTVEIACNEKISPVPACYREWGCPVYELSCTRSPLDQGNRKAVGEIRELVTKNHYDIVHCHTPVAAACTRMACKEVRKKGTRVIYTAHGFHFYQGAPLQNWATFYPVEKSLSKYTDVLITINTEDYERAKKEFRALRTEYVPGVGVDTAKFAPADGTSKIREEFGIAEDQRVILSVGELNENKNHESVIRALSALPENYVYVIVGSGGRKQYLEELAEQLHLKERVLLTGHRDDVVDFYHAADMYILPSLREGLNVSLMEAMASGLPCAAGRIRGNTDLIDEKGGALFNPRSVEEIGQAIQRIMSADRSKMGTWNMEKVRKFSSEEVIGKMLAIYDSVRRESVPS